MIRTVVIGMGGRGRVWAKALRDHPVYALSAIVDPSPEVLQEAAA